MKLGIIDILKRVETQTVADAFVYDDRRIIKPVVKRIYSLYLLLSLANFLIIYHNFSELYNRLCYHLGWYHVSNAIIAVVLYISLYLMTPTDTSLWDSISKEVAIFICMVSVLFFI